MYSLYTRTYAVLIVAGIPDKQAHELAFLRCLDKGFTQKDADFERGHGWQDFPASPDAADVPAGNGHETEVKHELT